MFKYASTRFSDDPNNQIKLEFVTFKNDHNIITYLRNRLFLWSRKEIEQKNTYERLILTSIDLTFHWVCALQPSLWEWNVFMMIHQKQSWNYQLKFLRIISFCIISDYDISQHRLADLLTIKVCFQTIMVQGGNIALGTEYIVSDNA